MKCKSEESKKKKKLKKTNDLNKIKSKNCLKEAGT